MRQICLLLLIRRLDWIRFKIGAALFIQIWIYYILRLICWIFLQSFKTLRSLNTLLSIFYDILGLQNVWGSKQRWLFIGLIGRIYTWLGANSQNCRWSTLKRWFKRNWLFVQITFSWLWNFSQISIFSWERTSFFVTKQNVFGLIRGCQSIVWILVFEELSLTHMSCKRFHHHIWFSFILDFKRFSSCFEIFCRIVAQI